MENVTINDINTMIRIAKNYYNVGLSQEQISIEEAISKSTVLRILDRAEKLGYIKHELIYPVKSVALQEELLNFDIEHIFVSPPSGDNFAGCRSKQSWMQRICEDC